MQQQKIALSCALATIFLAMVAGHGMVLEPPNRSSMWRFDPDSEPNWDDNQMYCGGFSVQWEQNGGKCGLCGDDYNDPRPRDNENTGRYGKGKIARTYQSGNQIDVAVYIENNHWGYFNFSLCPLLARNQPEPGEECFEQLSYADGSLSWTIPNHNSDTFYNVTLQLPQGLTCEQCVLRWKWNAGNTWGPCDDGSHAVGCGPQETFMSCSDIAIV